MMVKASDIENIHYATFGRHLSIGDKDAILWICDNINYTEPEFVLSTLRGDTRKELFIARNISIPELLSTYLNSKLPTQIISEHIDFDDVPEWELCISFADTASETLVDIKRRFTNNE